MRPAEITTDQIVEAGQMLLAAGRNITGFALRQRIGGGNPARLMLVWEEHMRSKGSSSTAVVELPVEVADQLAEMTNDITAKLAALASSLHQSAVQAAERRVADVLRASADQRTQTDTELADAAATVEQLEGKLEQADQTIADLRQQLKAALDANQLQGLEVARLSERLVAQTQAGAKLEGRISAVEADRDRARDEAAVLRGQIAVLESPGYRN